MRVARVKGDGPGARKRKAESGSTFCHPQPYTLLQRGRSKGLSRFFVSCYYSMLAVLSTQNQVLSTMDRMADPDSAGTTRIALLFEGGLGVGALAIGWLLGHSPLVGISGESEQARNQVAAIGWGLVATGPLLVALVVMERFPVGPLGRLREMTTRVILQMFGGATVAQLAVVSIAAGFGEELLFRGLVQAGLSRLFAGTTGLVVGLVAASVLFGVCHWLNTTYAILAMLAGAYFGLLLLLTGNILTPIVAHAAYDFLALIYLIHPQHLLGSEQEQ